MWEISERKEAYRELCRSEPTIPLFSRDWWLDTVCGENNWDISLVVKGGQIVGTMPYHVVKRRGMTTIMMPPLTIAMGPWVRYTNTARNEKVLKHEVDLISELIDGLPPFGAFNQKLHYSVTNWLPFYWRGFEQTTRYSYIIPDLTDMGKVFNGFEHGVRNLIKKTQGTMTVEESDDIQTFYEINSQVFKRQGMAVPYSFDFIKNLDSKCREKGVRRLMFARDKNGEVHAVKYIVWDEGSAYALMSGYNTAFKSDGAPKLLTWEAMKFASTVTKQYDFLGSMLVAVENTNRRFGAVQVPYFSISKTNSLRLKLLDAVRDITVGLIH